MNRLEELAGRMDILGNKRIPFLFIVDFECIQPLLFPLSDLPESIHFSTPDHPDQSTGECNHPVELIKSPVSFEDYAIAFSNVRKHLQQGNSYLVNLTFPTPVSTTPTLREIYLWSRADYRLLVDNRFVVFSPEPFVKIRNGIIRSFPMKGTIDAALPDAERRILADPKESAEHNTIVDLIRNDLSKVATEVKVARFRYIDRIKTLNHEILQVSSEITGRIHQDFENHIGQIICKLLPAGSVSGAPKSRTLEIIRETEGSSRGFYTGVFGIFDGTNLESAVMIRFIEKTDRGLIFRSGGGITHLSDPEAEYREMVAKVYLQF